MTCDGVSAAWTDLAEGVVRSAIRRVFVAGPADVGKSALCRMILAFARDQGRRALLLDTDLGQKMVGPPACVTLGQSTSETGLALSRLAFVGTTDPVRGWRGLVDGSARLSESAQADLLVVNTSGLLSGPGRRLKADKIDVLSPDLLVVIGDDPAVDRVLGDHPLTAVGRVSASPHARRKRMGERRAARRDAFRQYFASGRNTAFPLALLVPASSPAMTALPLAGLLVGLSDRRGDDVGMGIVTTIDVDAGTITCLTRTEPLPVAGIRPGALVIHQDFTDARL